MTLNEGVYHYLQGQAESDEDSLDLAIKRFTSVIKREPDNATAILFRALSHGQLGLLVRREKDDSSGTAFGLKEVLELRENPERLSASRAGDPGSGTGAGR